jgi:predicted DNA-binding transcriptional regulator YafY
MPPRLRRQMDAVASQTDAPGPWEGAPVFDAAVLTTLAQACRDSEVLRFDYTAREAEVTHRRVEPLRLVSLGRRWYLVAWDRDRTDWRSFRLDRVSDPQPTGPRFRPRELPAEDALAFVRQGINRMPQRYVVRARVAIAADALAQQVGRWGTVTEDGDGCVLEMNVDDLDWPVMVLAGSGAEFVVESPPELAARVAEVGQRFARVAAG